MAETRIRWSDNPETGEVIGCIGTLAPVMFRIDAVPDVGQWLLTTTLPGMERKGLYYGDPDELKAEAERWLEEFVASLGAVFPDEPGAMFADMTEAEAFEVEFRARYSPGRRVRFARPDAGYSGDQEMAARLLTPGEVYTIAWSDIGFSSSRLGLAGIESRGQGFNSVLFEPVDDPATPAPMAGEKE